jgi:hypothetical protein
MKALIKYTPEKKAREIVGNGLPRSRKKIVEMKIKLYVHKYLGCLCLDDGELHIYSMSYFMLLKFKEGLHQSPECWEQIDEWEE